ncbi:MAG: FAD-dependent oxidoreductase [Methanomassiliicoccales archaeon]|nr:MAG: FAD-dependent oxidoreductase [Methanomassiliicoccales archaeon]
MDEFEVVIIGAGPAGSCAAYRLAREGFNVLLVERANTPGSKNVFGGRIYSYPLTGIFPDFWKEAPIERYVTQENMVFMTESNSVTMKFDSSSPEGVSAQSFTVLREKFDSWLAKKAQDAGALLITGTRVDDLYWENGRIAGIVAGPDTVRGNVVIGADGVVSTFAQKAGLRRELTAKELSVAVKQTIKLPEETIEDRFNLSKREGAAYGFVGYASGYLRGGGFLYTNKDTVSLGVVVSAEDLALRKKEIFEIMEDFKLHPSIQKLVRGGEVIEYSAHMIPEMGINTLPALFKDNFLAVGDAGGLLINHGYTYRGVDLAMISGVSAAEAIVQARQKGDYSKMGLSAYPEILRKKGVMKDMVAFRRTPRFLQNARLFTAYPRMVCDFFDRLYTVDGKGKEKVFDIGKKEILGKVSIFKMLRDMLGGFKSV